MTGPRYICPEAYRCMCVPGTKVSLTTVRRHRDTAEQRLRRERQSPFVHLQIPGPIPYGAPPNNSQISSSPQSDQKIVSNLALPSWSSGPNQSGISSDAAAAQHGTESQHVQSGCSRPNGGSEDDLHYESLEVSSGDSEQSVLLITSLSHSDDFGSYSSEENEESSQAAICGLQEFDGLRPFMQDHGWLCGFFLRHRSTIASMDDVLSRMLPDGFKSWKTVQRHIQDYAGIRLSQFSYCSASHELLEVNEAGEISVCSHKDCSTRQAPIKEVMYIGLWERLLVRLQSSLDGPELLSHVRESYMQNASEEFEHFIDFYSGTGFREYVEQLEDFCNEAERSDSSLAVHLFLFMSLDGAPAFRSSTKSFWPVILFLGNIPPDRRYQERNVFPSICVPGNPSDLQSFLRPLFDELESLQKGMEAVLWDGRRANVRCHLLHEMTDLQAKKKLCLAKGVNGYFPCLYCEICGQRGASDNLYYPDHLIIEKRRRNGSSFKSRRTFWNPASLPMRSEEGIRSTFAELDDLRPKNDIKALKELMMGTGIIAEPEVVIRFKSIRPYLSMPIDLMHLLFENIAPQLLNIWMGTVDTGGEHSYLSQSATIRFIDSMLEHSRSGIIDSFRSPRGLKAKGMWKADEWRTFVVTTSLVVLHQILPSDVLNGWWTFVRICELSMRPQLSAEDRDDLSTLCTSFFKHYSAFYYRGLPERMHLMKYTIHLILHIPHSMDFCGPLVCLSQFPVELYIGKTKEITKAKHLIAESITKRWVFEQSAIMCEIKAGARLPLWGVQRDDLKRDERSRASNAGRYHGYFLGGPCVKTTVRELSDKMGFDLVSSLHRYYVSDLGITRHEAESVVFPNTPLTIWNRLAVRKTSHWAPQKYKKFNGNGRTCSRAFFAAEFESSEHINVYYGRVVLFIEHEIYRAIPSGPREARILVVSDWASRGLKVGKQHQIFSVGERSSRNVFQTRSVEDVACICRNISVLECKSPHWLRRSTRTYFVDERLMIDRLLTNDLHEGTNKLLQGVSSL